MPSTKAVSKVPLTIIWQNTKMIRSHSIRECAREILQDNVSNEVCKINLIAPPSKGKTTCAKALAHIIHGLSNTPYLVRVLKRADLMNMEGVLASLPVMNHILIFDDVSWLVAENNKSKIDQVTKTFTEIRHLPGGQDVKVIIFFLFHYSNSVPKHLRQADFYMYFDVGSEEMENIQKIVGVKNTEKLKELRKARSEIKETSIPAIDGNPEYHGTFSYKMPGKGNWKFTYQHRNPFAPALFWNGNTLRHVVFPAREWIDPICSICSGSTIKSEEERGNIAKFVEIANKTYQETTIRNALRIILYKRGINCFDPRIKRAINWIEREWQGKVYDFEEIMKAYNLQVNNVHINAPSIAQQEEKNESPIEAEPL